MGFHSLRDARRWRAIRFAVPAVTLVALTSCSDDAPLEAPKEVVEPIFAGTLTSNLDNTVFLLTDDTPYTWCTATAVTLPGRTIKGCILTAKHCVNGSTMLFRGQDPLNSATSRRQRRRRLIQAAATIR